MLNETIIVLAAVCTIVGSLLGGVAGFYIAMSRFVTKDELNTRCKSCKDKTDNLRDFIEDVKADFQHALDEMKKDFRGWLDTLKRT